VNVGYTLLGYAVVSVYVYMDVSSFMLYTSLVFVVLGHMSMSNIELV